MSADLPHGQGVRGHALVQQPIDAYRSHWHCSCGLYQGRGRPAARIAQREHVRSIRPYPADTLRERVLSRLVIDPSGCLLWTGGLTGGKPADAGYGKVSSNRKTLLVHRLMYEWFVGPIPPGLEIDHVRDQGCHHRNCASPAHLEAVTSSENTLRAYKFQRGTA